MDRVYLISRYRAERKKQVEFNCRVARHFCKKILDEGKLPVAPHLYYTQFLDDDFPDERNLGLDMGIRELRNSQEFLLVVIDGVISAGMRRELAEASRLGMPGSIVSLTSQQIKEEMKVVR